MANSYVVACRTQFNKPWWREDPDSDKWQGVMGEALDDQKDRFLQARAVRYPTVPAGQLYACPSDALSYLSAERGLERVPGESEDAWRERLRRAWPIWHVSGTQQIHIDEFGWAGILNVTTVRRHEWSTPAPVGTPYVRSFARLVWFQFDVLVQRPHPWRQKRWGDGDKWGEHTWGTSMTTEELTWFRREIRERKAGHDTCTYLHISFADGRLWGPNKWGDGGKWGGSGNVVSFVIGEQHWETRRLM